MRKRLYCIINCKKNNLTLFLNPHNTAGKKINRKYIKKHDCSKYRSQIQLIGCFCDCSFGNNRELIAKKSSLSKNGMLSWVEFM